MPSWPPGARAHSIVVDAANPRRCLVGIEVGGVVISDDDGETWSTIMPGGDPDIHVIVADPSHPQTVYASTGFGRIGKLAEQPDQERIAGMFVSHDGGHEWQWLWQSMQRQYTRPLCIDDRPPHAVTVGTAHSARPYITYRLPESADGRLYQSTDQGATWHALGDDAHSPSDATLLCLTPADDAAGNVLVGTDAGEVWHVTGRQHALDPRRQRSATGPGSTQLAQHVGFVRPVAPHYGGSWSLDTHSSNRTSRAPLKAQPPVISDDDGSAMRSPT